MGAGAGAARLHEEVIPITAIWTESERDRKPLRPLGESGEEKTLNMIQWWPVRRPIPESMFRLRLAKRQYPSAPLTTTTRIIDTFFPIAKGGTGCIPGPFGAGKTVLQSIVARYSAVDIVIIVACMATTGLSSPASTADACPRTTVSVRPGRTTSP